MHPRVIEMEARRRSSDGDREQLERSAEQLLRQGRVQQALQCLQKAPGLRRVVTPTRVCPQVQQLLQVGSLQAAQQAPGMAVALMQALLRICADLPVHQLARELFDLHSALAQAYKQQGDLEAAQSEVERGLEAAAEGEVPRAEGYLHLCVLCTALGQHTRALAAAHRAVQFAQEEAIASSLSNSPSKAVFAERLAVAYHNLGVIQEQLHSLPEAIAWYSKAARVAESLEHVELRSQVQASLAAAKQLKETEGTAPLLGRRKSQYEERAPRTTQTNRKQPWQSKPSHYSHSRTSSSMTVQPIPPAHHQVNSSLSSRDSFLIDEDEDLRELEAMGVLEYSMMVDAPREVRPRAIRVRGRKRPLTSRREGRMESWEAPAELLPLSCPLKPVYSDTTSPSVSLRSDPVSATPPTLQPCITPFPLSFTSPEPLATKAAVVRLQSWVRARQARKQVSLMLRLKGKIELRTCKQVGDVWTVVTIVRAEKRREVRVEREGCVTSLPVPDKLSTEEVLDSIVLTEGKFALQSSLQKSEPPVVISTVVQVRSTTLQSVRRKDTVTAQTARALSQAELMKVVLLQSLVRMKKEQRRYNQRRRGKTVSVRREVEGGDYLVSAQLEGSNVEVDAYPLTRGLHRPPKAQFFETFLRSLLYLPSSPWSELGYSTVTHVRITGNSIDFPEIYRLDATLGTKVEHPVLVSNWAGELQVEIPYREEFKPSPALIRITTTQLRGRQWREGVSRVRLITGNILVYLEDTPPVYDPVSSEKAAIQIQRRVRGILARKALAVQKHSESRTLLFFRRKVLELEEYYVAMYRVRTMLQIESYKVTRSLGIRYKSQILNWQITSLEEAYGQDWSMEMLYTDLRLIDGTVVLQPRTHLVKVRSDRNALVPIRNEVQSTEARILLRASKRLDSRMWVVIMAITEDNQAEFSAFCGSTELFKVSIGLSELCRVTRQPAAALHPIGCLAINHLLKIRNKELVLDLNEPIPSSAQLIARVQAHIRGFLIRRNYKVQKPEFGLVAFGLGLLGNRRVALYAYTEPLGLVLEAVDRHSKEKFYCKLEEEKLIQLPKGVNRKRIIEQLIFPRLQLIPTSTGPVLQLVEASGDLSRAQAEPFVLRPQSNSPKKHDMKAINLAYAAVSTVMRTKSVHLKSWRPSEASSIAEVPIADLPEPEERAQLVVRSGLHLLDRFYTASIFDSGVELWLEVTQAGAKPLRKSLDRTYSTRAARDKYCSELLSRIYLYQDEHTTQLDLAPSPDSPGIIYHCSHSIDNQQCLITVQRSTSLVLWICRAGKYERRALGPVPADDQALQQLVARTIQALIKT